MKIIVISFLVYFFSWLFISFIGLNTLAIQSEDTIPAMFMPVTIIKEQTLYADSYYEMIRSSYPNPDDKTGEKGLVPFYFKKVDNHYISAFPLVTGVISLPVFFFPIIFGMPITFDNLAILSHITAGFIVAFSGLFFYKLLKKHLIQDDQILKLLTAAYLFGTINFSLVSQSLWQHGTLQLFVILGLYFLLNAFTVLNTYSSKKALINIFISSLFFGLSILSRPTAFLIYAVMFVLLMVTIKNLSLKRIATFLLTFFSGIALCALIFFWYNNKFYVSVNNQGYYDQIQTEWLSRFPEGFIGTWISPSKGILVYSPIFIFIFASAFIVYKRKKYKEDSLFIFFALIVILHTLIMGKWKHWYGGWSFGYRMSSDVIPFLVLLLIPYLRSELFIRTKKLFYGLLIVSVLIQIGGLVFFDGVWHAAYDRGFVNTSWLWSIQDSEFVFNARRVLVKLGILQKACPQCLP